MDLKDATEPIKIDISDPIAYPPVDSTKIEISDPVVHPQPTDLQLVESVPLSEAEIYNILLEFQVKHVKQLFSGLQKFNCVLDSSDAGVGKTYVAMAMSALFSYSAFVICPKSVISTWKKVAKLFRVNLLGVINYESIKIGKYYGENDVKTTCPYIEVLEGGQNFKWKLPEKTLLIFDEVHKCKNLKSQNSKLLSSSKTSGAKIMMLSATVADRPQFFANCAYMLDFCTNVKIFNIYLKALQNLNPHDSIMMALHKKIFPNKGSRLRIAELGDLFPKNQIVPETYTMGKDIEQQIQEQYELLSVAVQDLKKKEKNAVHPLERMMRARQKIEALKVQTLIELANDYLESGHSVVIFTNFRDSLNLLANKLGTDCLIHGEQTLAERDRCVDNFQENKEKLIIANMASGSVGISLHDIKGGHPRVSLISPTWSSGDLIQALGRIHRANGKTHCLQRIIFCANTIEDMICANLQVKINNYSAINDGKEESTLQLVKK